MKHSVYWENTDRKWVFWTLTEDVQKRWWLDGRWQWVTVERCSDWKWLWAGMMEHAAVVMMTSEVGDMNNIIISYDGERPGSRRHVTLKSTRFDLFGTPVLRVSMDASVVNWLLTDVRHFGFWATVCKTVRPMLSVRCPVCLCPVCLSVCL